MICDIDLWPHSWPWPWMFQGQISKELYLKNVGLIDVKWKESELIGYCADYDFALWSHPWPWSLSFKVRVCNSIYQIWDGRLTWNKKDFSHPSMTMILTNVTVLGWADVPDSDCGDFRRRRAVDISSLWWSYGFNTTAFDGYLSLHDGHSIGS